MVPARHDHSHDTKQQNLNCEMKYIALLGALMDKIKPNSYKASSLILLKIQKSNKCLPLRAFMHLVDVPFIHLHAARFYYQIFILHFLS